MENASDKQMEYLKSLIDRAVNAHTTQRDYEVDQAQAAIEKHGTIVTYREVRTVRDWDERDHAVYFWQLIAADFESIVLDKHAASRLIDLFKGELDFNPTYAVDHAFSRMDINSEWYPEQVRLFVAFAAAHEYKSGAEMIAAFEASLTQVDGELETIEDQRQALIEAGVDVTALVMLRDTEFDIALEQETAIEETMRALGRKPYAVNIAGNTYAPALALSSTVQAVNDELRQMTTDEAARELGISKRAVQKAIERKSLKARKMGRDCLINQSDIQSYRRFYLGKPGRKGL